MGVRVGHVHLPGEPASRRARWPWTLALVAVLAGSATVVTLSRQVINHDSSRLLSSQAGLARSAVVGLISQVESGMSSVGAVAAATNGSPAGLDRIISVAPGLALFADLSVLRTGPAGSVRVLGQRGAPSAALTSLSGPAGRQLADVVRRGGLAIVGFFGVGANRRLALALGAPEVPAGYLVYAEVPLPPGTSISGGVPGVGYVMYAGPTDRYPVLFATSPSTPLRGPQVSQLVDLDNPDGSGSQAGPVRPLLFLVSFSGPAVGRLASLLPWIVGAALLIAGLLMAGVVDATRRRRNLALAQVSELQVKNAELDQAVSDQLAAESARARLEGELRQAQRL
ncbi:MAG: hypothetical protein ACYDAQ_10860, partial [Mycobacteriales bacterium]